MHIDLILVLWGKTYRDDFISYTLPMLLAPGNLPDWPWLQTSRLCLYTTESDWLALEQVPLWQTLKRMLQTDCYALSEEPDKSRYNRMAKAHQSAIAEAAQQDHSVIFLAPDLLLPINTLQTIARYIQTGIKGILCYSLYFSDTVKTELEQLRQGDCLEVSLEQELAWLNHHLHPRIKRTFWDADEWVINPGSISYINENGQTCYRSFFYHPIYIRNPQPMHDIVTIDSIYMQQYAPEIKNWLIAPHSELLYFSFKERLLEEPTVTLAPEKRLDFLYDLASQLTERMPIAYEFFSHEGVFSLPFNPCETADPLAKTALTAFAQLLRLKEDFRHQDWPTLLAESHWPTELVSHYPLLGLLYDLRCSALYATQQFEALQQELPQYREALKALPLSVSRLKSFNNRITSWNNNSKQDAQILLCSEQRWITLAQAKTFVELSKPVLILMKQINVAEWDLWRQNNWHENLEIVLATTPLFDFKRAQQVWIPLPLEPFWEPWAMHALLEEITVHDYTY